MSLKKTQAENGPILIESKRSRYIPGSVRGAGANLAARSFASLRSITGTITTTTIRPMGATGNCCVSTVTTTSTRGSR